MGGSRIAVIGDYNSEKPSHPATSASIEHAANALGSSVTYDWISTISLAADEPDHLLSGYDGIWCAPGSPYPSLEGALRGIQYARESSIPFFGTCGGCQHALLEYGRNVLKIAAAQHLEYDDAGGTAFITPTVCVVPGADAHGPRLAGGLSVLLQEGSRLRSIYGRDGTEEQYRCSFELNPAYVETVERGGLRIAARDEDGSLRAIEIDSHPWFVATLFMPQLSSTAEEPHPLVVSFVDAVVRLGSQSSRQTARA
jgi:CTP synthase (UTP-ammonia lyase)